MPIYCWDTFLCPGSGGVAPDYPSTSNVKVGVAYDHGSKVGTYEGLDRYTDPGTDKVKLNTTYKFNNVNRTGTYQPSAPTLTPARNIVDFPTIEAKLSVFISGQLTYSAGVSVPAIWAKQGEARPHRPYAALQYLNAPKKIGTDDQSSGTTGNTVSGYREITIQVNVFGQNAFSMLTDLQNANEYASVRDDLAKAGIVMVEASPIRDLSGVEGSGFQTRGQMDITFRVKALAVDTGVGYIQDVKLIDDLDGSTTIVGQ
jgi:hypothetical protein